MILIFGKLTILNLLFIMKKLLLPLMVMATMFACTSPETKKADAASESADPRTGTFTSQDDKSQKVKELIDKESDVKIIGSKYVRNIDFIKEECNDLDYFKFDDYFKAALKNTYFTSSSTIVAMSFFTHNYGFNSNLQSGEDIDVWFRAVYSGGNAFYINNQLVYYSDEDENQVTKSKPDLKKSLVGNISNLYAEELKSNHNKSFRKLVSVYIYFNLYPYFFDLRYREEAKKVLNENQLFLFWLNLLYILPFSIGAKLMQSKNNNKKIRLYLKFIIRYIYT